MKNGLLLPEGETLAEELASPDREIVERAIAGDKDAFSALFRLTYQQMFFAARKILRRDEDIYDALQIGYIKAYKYIDRLNDPDKFVPWLYRIVENAAKDVYKDVYGQSEQMLDEDVPVSDDTEETERRADIRDALATLPLEQAEVLSLYYYDGLTLAEISRLLGVKQNTVYSRLTAAKKALLKELEIRGIDRSVYGGGVFTAIAVALRSVIGTDILSATVAQKMLDNVLSGTPGRLECAAANLVARKRNRAILRIAGLLMLFCAFVTVFTTLLALWLSGNLNNTPTPSMPELPAWLWTTEDESTTSATTTASSPTMVGNPTGIPGWVPPGNVSATTTTATPSRTSHSTTRLGATASSTTTGTSGDSSTTTTTTTTTTASTTRSTSSTTSTTNPLTQSGTELRPDLGASYQPGSIRNGVYENQSLGIRFEIPDGWVEMPTEDDYGTFELDLRDYRQGDASSKYRVYVYKHSSAYYSNEDAMAFSTREEWDLPIIGRTQFYGFFDPPNKTANFWYTFNRQSIRISVYAATEEEMQDLFSRFQPL